MKRPKDPLTAKFRKFMRGGRLPFAPTRTQPVTSDEARQMVQVKKDRAFLEGQGVGEPVDVLQAVAPPPVRCADGAPGTGEAHE